MDRGEEEWAQWCIFLMQLQSNSGAIVRAVSWQ